MERLEARALLAVLGDPGFETVPVGFGFLYAPTGSAWTFTYPAAIASNASAFVAAVPKFNAPANPNAPDGGQVAALQNHGVIAQTVANWDAGTYTISFLAAQRANNGPSAQDFQVLIDDTVVGTYAPTQTSYQPSTTTPLTLTAGSHTVTFRGLDTVGYDSTVFLDFVGINQVAAGPQLGDPSFESVPVGFGYRYAPTGSAWTFTYPAALAGNGSDFTEGNSNTPDGTQVAVLQQQGVISQTVAGWGTGTYTVSFLAAQRINSDPFTILPRQDFQVLIDNTVVATVTPSGIYDNELSAWKAYTTTPLALTAGSHTITFRGLDTMGGDYSALIDAVSVSQVPAATLGDAGFETPPQVASSYQYNPTGTAWNFVGTAGVTGYNSGFTSSTPLPPEGQQEAFLQVNGSISQAVTGWAAGTYDLSFLAVQRGLYSGQNEEDFQVLIDGTVVGTYAPNAVQTDNHEYYPGYYYTTSSPLQTRFVTTRFSVAAGTHTITFQGLDDVGGDNTVLLDAVAINTIGS